MDPGGGGDPQLTCGPLYSLVNGFIFFTSACFGCLPNQGAFIKAEYTRNKYMHHNITHTFMNPQRRLRHSFVNFNTSSQQAKQLLWCHVIDAGSSGRVELAVKEVISLPTASL
jgi:hypothetical protein